MRKEEAKGHKTPHGIAIGKHWLFTTISVYRRQSSPTYIRTKQRRNRTRTNKKSDHTNVHIYSAPISAFAKHHTVSKLRVHGRDRVLALRDTLIAKKIWLLALIPAHLKTWHHHSYFYHHERMLMMRLTTSKVTFLLGYCLLDSRARCNEAYMLRRG